MRERHDILIVGGGPVGATLALALRGYGHAVTLLEARKRDVGARDARTLALSQGSRLILQRLGVWNELAPLATPIETIHVSQRGRFGRTILRAEDERQEALGYVLSYAALSDALERALAETQEIAVQYGARAVELKSSEDEAVVNLELDGKMSAVSARFVVLADGGRSLKELPGMKRETREYGHSALVAHVECELPHGNIAYERFTPLGPVALLPEGEHGFALIWTANPEEAERLRSLPEVEFLEDLYRHFGDRVGKFIEVHGRATFPLQLSTLRPVVAQRLAVIGNAAQTLHPVAGQGFNLGLRDAWELARIARKTPADDIGSAGMLTQYQTQRRMDTGGGIFFTDFLVRAFSNDIPGLGPTRGAGLAVLDMLAPAKHFVARKMSFGAKG
jgi:2-octaprenyl-6-methoxyphenol hydroxylase